MKLSKAEYQFKTMNLDEDEDGVGLPSRYTLSKAQAICLLYRLHQASIAKHTVPDTAISWHWLLEENIRDEAPNGSFHEDGSFKRRGNRGKWGALPSYRSHRGGSCRVFFNEQDIIEWYQGVERVLSKPATVTAITR